MKYRAEIDGLRALAIIPVILFHAGFNYFSGGFVGVDIFFVISGYLITTIILNEMDQGSFSLAHFYERRARRILPALFLVIAATLPFSWFLLLPQDMTGFGHSLIAVSTFASNILFWRESGYWGPVNDFKPLLHTWSLAVEEQYYVLFPLFLIFMWRFRKQHIFLTLAIITVASLATAQWGAHNKPNANFFLLPTRAWELAIGACVAFILLYRASTIDRLKSNRAIAEISGNMGLFLLGYSVVMYSSGTPFPSLYTIVPCLGASLIIIFSSPATTTGRILGSKPLVFIGLISYGAYLWHQPLFSLTRHARIQEPSPELMVALIFLTFFLAFLSWRYIETPLRSFREVRRQTIFIISGSISFLFICIGLLFHIYQGFPDRISNTQRHIYNFKKYEIAKPYRKNLCFLGQDQKPALFSDECISDTVNSLVIWGDSHAAALSYGLKNTLRNNFTQLTSVGCPPLIGYHSPRLPNCKPTNDHILKLLTTQKPEVIILHGRWFRPRPHGLRRSIKDYLPHTIRTLRKALPETRIVILGGLPQWHKDLPDLLVQSDAKLDQNTYIHTDLLSDVNDTDNLLMEISKTNGATFIPVTNTYCKTSSCITSARINGYYEPFAWDYGHLTKASSLSVSRDVLDQIFAEP